MAKSTDRDEIKDTVTGQVIDKLSKDKEPVTVTDPAVDRASFDKLVTARISLLLKAPFFGNLATRLKLQNADNWLSTAATDGRYFYYNSEFVKLLPQKQLEFLVGHEVLHVVYDHMGRRGDRHPKLSNIAADYCVNQDLVDQKIGEKISVVPVLYDEKYSGMSYEEVYDDLLENCPPQTIDDLIDQLLDEHLDGDDADGDGDGENGNGEGNGSGNGPAKMSAEEKKALRDEIREAVLNAAQQAEAGSLPSGVKRMINVLTSPQMNWRELIQQKVQALVKADYSWMRPSRRSHHMDAIMPGNSYGEKIEVDVSIDASGSMNDNMLRDILSEVKGIMQTFDDFVLRVWTFDTQVYGFEKFTPDNIDDIDTYELHGGGGTDFMCNWEFMKEQEIEPKLFIMFTDMYPCSSWGDADYCDTLFVGHGTTSIVAPFGDTAYYDLSKAA